MLDYVMAKDGSWHYAEVNNDHEEIMAMLKRILQLLEKMIELRSL